MISVVIPTLNSEADLPRTLSALVPAAVDGFIREVIVSDGGSADQTARIADSAGVVFHVGPKGRGAQLAEGARRARFPWLLFLHADTVLEDGWMREAAAFMTKVDHDGLPEAAAAFRFKLADRGIRPRLLEAIVWGRCRLLRLPYGDQGFLIPRRLYDQIGGFAKMPIMEDVDLVRRLGRRRVALFESGAVTSADRFRREGYLRRILRNQTCLALYTLGMPADRIASVYEPGDPSAGRARQGRIA